MALRWAVVSGNWSNPATWNGGTTTPGPGDDVRTNSFVVNIDQNITVDRISHIDDAANGVNFGGSFTVDTSVNRVLNVATGIQTLDQFYNNVNFVLLQAGSGAVTVNAPTVGGPNGTNSHNIVAAVGYTGAITINGTLLGGARGAALRTLGTPSSVTINGNVTGATVGASTLCLLLGAATVCDIYGNIVGPRVGGSGLSMYGQGVTVTVHGTVSGGPSPTPVGGSYGVEMWPSHDTNRLTVLGGVLSTSGGIAISCSNGTVHVSNGTFRVNGSVPISSSSSYPIELSGVIYVWGSEGPAAAPAVFPISGTFVIIAGETLDIVLLDDSAFPTSMQGEAALFTTSISATTVPVNGNASEVEMRADGTMLTIMETDPNTVTLSLPNTFDATDVPTLTDQINEVFAPPSVIESGWLTVTAQGILGLADTSDPGGEPDVVPVAGTVTLTPSLRKPIRQLSTSDIFVVTALVATFDADGVLSYDGVPDVRVLAPQWNDLSNTEWKWLAEVRPGAGQSWAAWSVTFTGAPGAVINLAALIV